MIITTRSLCLLLGASALAVACAPRAADEGTGSERAAMAAPANDSTPAARLRQQLLATLAGYEHVVTRDELTRLAPEPELTAALIALYHDAGVHLVLRVQALTSLRFFPGADSRATLEGVLLNAGAPDLARRVAVRAYAVGFRGQAVPLLTRLLGHADPHTRDAAARSLGEIGGERALRERVPVGTSPPVKTRPETGLARAP